MDELLMRRIERKLANLSDERAYQVLDYVEFLEARYGTGTRESSLAEKLADRVEDTLRAGRLPVAAIRGAMGAVDSATRLMDRLSSAGRAAVDQLAQAARAVEGPVTEEPEEPDSAKGEPPQSA